MERHSAPGKRPGGGLPCPAHRARQEAWLAQADESHVCPPGSGTGCTGLDGLQRPFRWLRRGAEAVVPQPGLQMPLSRPPKSLPRWKKAACAGNFSPHTQPLVHNFGGIAGTSAWLSTARSRFQVLSPLALQRDPRAAHRVGGDASACHAKGKSPCPQKSRCFTTTTMYL